MELNLFCDELGTFTVELMFDGTLIIQQENGQLHMFITLSKETRDYIARKVEMYENLLKEEEGCD